MTVCTQRAHLKYCNPSVANVIEVDGSLEGVVLPGRAVGVILVPVDTGRVGGVIVGIIIQGALETLFPPCRDTPAVAHPVLPGLGADERVLVFVFCLVVSLQIHCVGAERVQTGLSVAH